MRQLRRISGRVAAATEGVPLRLAGQMLLTIGMLTLFLMLLHHRLADMKLAAILEAFQAVGPWQWALAGCATTVSFWAIGQYDVTMHRHLRLGTPAGRAATSGMAGIAVSQTLGLGLVTGALMRWRLLPGLSIWTATRLTVAVTASFMLGWGAVTSLMVLVFPVEVPAIWAGLSLSGIALLAVPGLILPGVHIFGRRLRLPNGLTLARLIGFTALDVTAAALALYALCPQDLGLSFTQLLPAYALALGAGMISGTPGGVGAFEVALLALLPAMPEASLLAGVLAFRAIYFALPAMIGGALALRGGGKRMLAPQWPADPGLVRSARRAEAMLLRQGDLDLLPTASATWLAGRCPHMLVALHDPLEAPPRPEALRDLDAAAWAEGRWPTIYKCNARTAARARRAGWLALPISREAHLDPARFDLGQPSRAVLRRKLRKAEAAGVQITCPETLPLPEMAELSAAWAKARGGERGFSMGRFCPDYVAGQRCYLAHVGGKLVAFVTFHPGLREWVLDLMRQSEATPDGTMQALVVAALKDAAAEGIPRLSLAAAPEAAFSDAAPALPGALARLASAEGAGLLQFKQGFAPDWQRLYLCAPNRRLAALAAAEIARAVCHPPPLRQGAKGDSVWVFSR